MTLISKSPTVGEAKLIVFENGIKICKRVVYIELPLSTEGSITVRLTIAQTGSVEYWTERFNNFMEDYTIEDKTVEEARKIIFSFLNDVSDKFQK